MELTAGAIFLAGLATFLSPCVLPMIPIYLSVLMGGSMNKDDEVDARARVRLLLNGTMFILGFGAVFVLLGLTATALGSFMLENRLLFQQLGGLLVFVFGLKFMGWLHIQALETERRLQFGGGGGRLGPVGSLVMGFTFAFGWTPCIGPVLGAILTYTAVSTSNLSDGAFNLLMYAAGIATPLFIVALLAQQGVGLLNKVKRFIPKFEKATGVALLAMGVLMVTDSTSLLTFGIGEDASAELSMKVAATADPSGAKNAAAVKLAQADPKTATDAVHVGGGPGGAAGAGEAGMCTGEGETCGIAPAADSDGPVASLQGEGARVLYFHQPHCPNCLKLAPVINAMTATCTGKGLQVQKVDVSQGPNKRFAAKKGVRGTPTLVFVDGDGTEVARLVGAVSLDQIHDATAVLMGDQCRDFSTM